MKTGVRCALIMTIFLATALSACTPWIPIRTPADTAAPPASYAPIPLSPTPDDKVLTTGFFTGNTYYNEYFDLSFQIPDGWTVATTEEMRETFQTNLKVFGSDDKEAERLMNLEKYHTLYFAYVLKHPIGTSDSGNPNLQVTCENLEITGSTGVTGQEYLAAVAGVMQRNEAIDYSFGSITEQEINGETFAMVDAYADYSGLTFRQKLYCVKRGNYVLAFTISWFKDGELSELQPIIGSIRFGVPTVISSESHVASSAAPANVITTGSFERMVYTNDYFGLFFKLPEDWHVATKGQIAEIQRVSMELLGSDDKEVERRMDLSRLKTLYLAYASKHPYGYPDGFNANLNLMGEKLGLAQGETYTCMDYALDVQEQIRKSIIGTEISYAFTGISSQQIDGREFAVMGGVVSSGEFTFTQKQYYTIVGDYALVFTFSWADDLDQPDVDSIAGSIRFD